MPAIVGSDWITTFTSVAIYSVAALGFGLLYGRVGMISLGQVALLTVGCWVGTRLAYATSLPFPLLLLAAGAITCAIGTLVGLPALRLSGLYLALITLMFAGATTVALSAIDFPNGGGGFKGRSLTGELTTSTPPVRRPSMATADTAYYRYTVVVCALLFLFALLHVSGKPGRAWASIRESEPAALAAGVNITLYKLWAFALASFVTGVAGCLLAAQVGVPRAITFQTQDSLILAATALIGGIFSLWGAVVAGCFQQLVPFLFQAQWGLNSNLLLILFGAGLLQVLLTAPGGLASSCRRISPGSVGWSSPRARAGGRGEEGAVIEVHGLTVRFAGVTPIDDDERRLPRRDVRPDRPERRRQDDVLQRPQRLRQARVGLDPRLRREPARDGRLQARPLGLRRTFQTEHGDRAAVGVRQRRDDPRALGREARLAASRRARRDRLRRARSAAEGQGRGLGARRAAARRGRARRRRQARASCCSTSLPPAFPTRRPSTSAT